MARGLIVYFEVEPVIGINVTYDDCHGQRFYDYFSSLSKFHSWMQYEMLGYRAVEITDFNYDELRAKGAI